MHTGLACQLCDFYLMQRTKINTEYIYWEEIMFGVPQGSIIGPLFLGLSPFLCDLFLIMENIDTASYADDTTLYTTGNSIEEVIQKLKKLQNCSFSGY